MASFSGFGGSGSGGAGRGRGRGQGARRDPIDQRGEELRATISDLIGNGHDAEVNEALRQSHHDLPDDQRPSAGVMITQVGQLVDLANISPQQAILRMAGAGWDYQAAVGTYTGESAGDDSSPSLSSPRGVEKDGDPGKVGGRGEGDRRVTEDTEEEGHSASTEGSLTPANRRWLAANPGTDRSVAEKGKKDLSKLMITLHRPNGGPDKVRHYHGEVNWEEPLGVGALNRWRAQYLRRHFGGTRKFRQHFHELEKDWLLNEHIDFEQKRLAQGKSVDYSAMRWGEITERFNRRFEGQYLPGAKTPRPSRTRVALRTERSRVRKITDHTGLPFRVHPPRGPSKRAAKKSAKKGSSDGEEDGERGKDEEDEGRGPRGIRRGDPPPGKKPWREDRDDEGRGGGGLSQPIRSSEIGV